VTAWSPDGEEIAYATDVLETPTIWVMNADGSDARRLTSGNWPSWSPDGERIVYTSYSGGTRLAVMNADGYGQRDLEASVTRRLTGRAYAEEPAWSPDGERIAFVSRPFMGDEEIYVVRPDGSGRRRLTDIPGADHWPPAWSPEGKRIAFTSDGTEEGGEIYVMNADGSGLTMLTDGPADASFPAWRP
jgi:TolB protein